MRFTAEVLADNRPMLAVFSRAGWPVERRFESGVVDLDFSLDDTEEFLDSVERLGLLIDDVLDLTRGGEGAAVERKDVDLVTVAREAAMAIQPAIKRHKIDFAVELSRSAGRVPTRCSPPSLGWMATRGAPCCSPIPQWR